MPVVALIEIRADDVSQVREHLEPQHVQAFYELMGWFNIGVIIRVESQQVLFDTTSRIREIPGVKETKTHLIQDGIVF
ncbi:MAG: hypothetical protein HXS46_13320 [Theionarchaea archaeon]|nr:MAG: hypothetical protein AYK18_09140 [Theionarchaea archaeon DG-70]MBU7011662.1 hypothetical protein [Theionarchaea archaeon]